MKKLFKILCTALVTLSVLPLTSCDDAKGFEKEARIEAHTLFNDMTYIKSYGPTKAGVNVSGNYICVPSKVPFEIRYGKKKYRGSYELTLNNDLDPTIFEYVEEVEKPGKNDNYIDFHLSYDNEFSSYSKYKINYPEKTQTINYNLWISCEVEQFNYVMDNEYTAKVSCDFKLSSTYEMYVYNYFRDVNAVGNDNYKGFCDSYYDSKNKKTVYTTPYHTSSNTLVHYDTTFDFVNGTVTCDNNGKTPLNLKLFEKNEIAHDLYLQHLKEHTTCSLEHLYTDIVPKLDEYHIYIGKPEWVSPYSKGMTFDEWISW